jgi:hypothetical protein
LLTDRLTAADNASLSEAFAVAPDAASAIDAPLTSGSVASDAAKATGSINVRVLPAPAATKAPVTEKVDCPAAPLSVPQLALPLATHVAAALSVTSGGSVSLTETSRASVGPPLAITIVYVPLPPGV